MKKKYDYNSVFLISNKTGKYYRYNGLNKVVSKEDKHDIWYYTFLESDKIFELDVDQDEADKNYVTIFVNCKIVDVNGNILAVAGVGIKMNYAQEIIGNFENKYDLEAFIVDEEGTVQVHTNSKFIEKRNIYDENLYKATKEDILNINNKQKIIVNESGNGNEFIVSSYLEEMDWYLLVRKNTGILIESFHKKIIYDGIVLIFAVLLVLTITIKVINKYQNKLTEMANTDPLLKLINRRGFDIKLKQKIENHSTNEWSVYIMDIDNFKYVNDRFGHVKGDEILLRFVKICSLEMKGHVLARWGGDEFAGIIEKNHKEAYLILENLRSKIENDEIFKKYNITVSMGVANNSLSDNGDSLITKADKKMYTAKEEGKNRIVY